MSLFVTRIPRDIEPVELEDRFRKFGEVVRFKLIEGKGYGFVEYQEKGDAENAIESLNGQEVFGERIVVEWSKSSGGGGGGAGGPSGARPRGRGCYNCGEEGHMSRECTRPPAPGAGRGAGGGGGRGCFKCGEEGHFARDCTNPSASNGGGGAPYERRRDDYGPSYSRRSPRRYDDRRERSPGRYDDRRDRSPRRYDDRRYAEDSRPPRYDRYDRDRPSYGRDSGYMSNGDRDRSYSKRDHSPPPPPSGDGPARGSPRRYEDNGVAPAAPPPHASDAPGDNGW